MRKSRAARNVSVGVLKPVASLLLTAEFRSPALEEGLRRLGEILAGQERGVPGRDVPQTVGHVRLALLAEHVLYALHDQRRVRGDLGGELARRGEHRGLVFVDVVDEADLLRARGGDVLSPVGELAQVTPPPHAGPALPAAPGPD